MLEEKAGHPIVWMCLPSHLTVRQIKTAAPVAASLAQEQLLRRLAEFERPDCG